MSVSTLESHRLASVLVANVEGAQTRSAVRSSR